MVVTVIETLSTNTISLEFVQSRVLDKQSKRSNNDLLKNQVQCQLMLLLIVSNFTAIIVNFLVISILNIEKGKQII